MSWCGAPTIRGIHRTKGVRWKGVPHSADSVRNDEVGQVMNELEDAAELEEPLVVTGIANAAANEDGAEGCFADESPDDVGGEPGYGVGIAIDFAKFAPAREIDLLADERRESKDLVEITAPREEILVAKQLVQAIGAQLVGPAEEKGRRRTDLAKAKGRAAAGSEKEGTLGGNRLESIQGNLQCGEIFRGARIVIIKMEEGLNVVALGGDDRFVGVIEDKAHFQCGDAATGRSKFRRTETQEGIVVADAIADAEFAEAIKAVAQINSRGDLILAV